jgi:hypothetical protein
MKKFLFFSVIFLIAIHTGKTKSADFFSINETAANIDFRNLSSTDQPWNLQFNYDVEATCGDNLLLGVEFDGTFFWLTGGGSPRKLYKLNPLGELVHWYYIAPGCTWRDLAWDGQYLYAGNESGGGTFSISIIDPTSTNPGVPIGTILVSGQGTNFARGLAYDASSDHFFTANFTANIMEIDREGNVIRSVPPPVNCNAIYGVAWEYYSIGGSYLWLHNQSGSPAQNTLFQMDPVTLTLTGYSYNYGLLPPNTGGIAGGLTYSNLWHPLGLPMLIVLQQGTPHDRIGGLLMIEAPIPPVSVQLFPINPPIIIPAGGGEFEYTIQIANMALGSPFQLWNIAILPNWQVYGPVQGPVTVNLNVGTTIVRQRFQSVPASAPSGGYIYRSYAGLYPQTLYSYGQFNFSKSPIGNAKANIENWLNWGDELSTNSHITTNIPADWKLFECYPNPFNSTSKIGFNLPERAQIELKILDIMGKEIKILVDSYLEAGFYEVDFTAGNLSSGIYFCVLKSEDFNEVKRLVLIK